MNNTEFYLMTKEKLLEMYEEAFNRVEELECLNDSQESIINELESEVEYWRDKYHSIT